MLIHNKDDIQFVTEFSCFYVTLYISKLDVKIFIIEEFQVAMRISSFEGHTVYNLTFTYNPERFRYSRFQSFQKLFFNVCKYDVKLFIAPTFQINSKYSDDKDQFKTFLFPSKASILTYTFAQFYAFISQGEGYLFTCLNPPPNIKGSGVLGKKGTNEEGNGRKYTVQLNKKYNFLRLIMCL